MSVEFERGEMCSDFEDVTLASRSRVSVNVGLASFSHRLGSDVER